MSGMRNIVVSIIENSLTPQSAADMILRLLNAEPSAEPSVEPEDEQEKTLTRPLPKRRGRTPSLLSTAAAEAMTRLSAPAGGGRKMRKRKGSAPPADGAQADPINPKQYYSMDVMREQTGYATPTIFVMIRENRLASKLEGNRRLILGADIIRVRNARGGVVGAVRPGDGDEPEEAPGKGSGAPAVNAY
jgi:hypothetical protein